jgi:hypothetical protein
VGNDATDYSHEGLKSVVQDTVGQPLLTSIWVDVLESVSQRSKRGYLDGEIKSSCTDIC